MQFVGADGCHYGWLAFVSDPGQGWVLHLYHTANELWSDCRTASRILVDIPIGLVSGPSPARACDVEARRLLRKGRASSVFPPPSRPALEGRSYEEACELNHGAVGRRLSRQTYNIMPKIRDFDDLLKHEAAARQTVRETHPEVCFWAFAGRPMRYNKKKPAGFDERLAVLAAVLPGARDIVTDALQSTTRHDAARDDILDALVVAVTAASPLEALATLPAIPLHDAAGLPMEMVFCQGSVIRDFTCPSLQR